MKKTAILMVTLTLMLTLNAPAYAAHPVTNLTAVVPDNTPTYTLTVPADFEGIQAGANSIGYLTVSDMVNCSQIGIYPACEYHGGTGAPAIQPGHGHLYGSSGSLRYGIGDYHDGDVEKNIVLTKDNNSKEIIIYVKEDDWANAKPGTYTSTIEWQVRSAE